MQSLEKLLMEGKSALSGRQDLGAAPARASGEIEGGYRFTMKSEYEPAGDQPQAIKELVKGVGENERDQVLLGVTGSARPSPWPR